MKTLRYDAGAAAYDRLTGRWSLLYAAAALEAADISATDQILDLAAGTGDAALLAAERLAPSGQAVAVDLSVPMLAMAGLKDSSESIALVAADAQVLPFADRTFDAAICLFGLMFFPNHLRALAEARRVMRPGARLALTVWGPPEAAPFAGFVAEALGEELPADRSDLVRPFSLSDPELVKGLLQESGYAEVEVRREIRTARFVSFEDYWDPVEAGGGRLGQAYLGLPRQAQAKVRRRVQEKVSPFTRDGQIAMELEAYLAVGRA